MGTAIQLAVALAFVFMLFLLVWSCLASAKLADEKWDSLVQMEQLDRTLQAEVWDGVEDSDANA